MIEDIVPVPSGHLTIAVGSEEVSRRHLSVALVGRAGPHLRDEFSALSWLIVEIRPT